MAGSDHLSVDPPASTLAGLPVSERNLENIVEDLNVITQHYLFNLVSLMPSLSPSIH